MALLLAVVALVASVVALPAVANPVPVPPPATTPDVLGPYTVTSEAIVGANGGGTGSGLGAPKIECKWELVDMNSAFFGDSANAPNDWRFQEANRQAGSPDFPQVGQLGEYYMNYVWVASNGTKWFDDDPSVGAVNSSGATYPCLVTPGVGAEMGENARHMIQVYANAGDARANPDGIFGTTDDVVGTPWNPIGERIIELWAAVDPPTDSVSDIRQVYWDIYHPDGTIKAQVHDRVGYGSETCQAGWSNFLGVGEADPNDPTSFGFNGDNTVFGAAVGTKQMNMEAAEDIVIACIQSQKKLYQSHFTLSKHQPCGEYKVVAHAAPVIGPEDTLTNYFDVYCFVHLDLDFTKVLWDDAVQDAISWSDGDFDMNTPTLPTAINAGSGAMTVQVEFFPMQSYENLSGQVMLGKWLEKFDVKFGISESTQTQLKQLGTNSTVIQTSSGSPNTGVKTEVNTTSGLTLCANEPGKFNFSLHTEGALAGKYRGTIKVYAIPHPDIERWCNNTKLNTFLESDGVTPSTGVWGGYRDLGSGTPDGGTAAGVPAMRPTFDDDYGRNQRSVDNQ